MYINKKHILLQVIPLDQGLLDPYPIRTKPDGSCFAHACSRIVYGNQEHTNEMRVKLIYTLVEIKHNLVDEFYLRQGLDRKVLDKLEKWGKQYSLAGALLRLVRVTNAIIDLAREVFLIIPDFKIYIYIYLH